MNTTGTIDRPRTHEPTKQVPTMKPSANESSVSTPFSRTAQNAPGSRQNRNRDMQLIPEALARAHMHDRVNEAESQRRAHGILSARRLQRRAERASMRARRALAMAVMN
ncbi:hypothetical protein [Streptomyces meridianus]|uniref:Uncharacterized protein n=1 Tax=Streptomyces meridianus TaxID=2938945 RepID=A0ABT0X2W2_9ACTN|nr:hypothetical protein [Streptomyces meridianus]MCM2576154.1 hypothetical protein [Streptomyces meridianus]